MGIKSLCDIPKWNDMYLVSLAIFDHINEVKELYTAYQVAKGKREETDEVNNLYESLNNELMDVHLLLEKWASAQFRKQTRLEKFVNKSNLVVNPYYEEEKKDENIYVKYKYTTESDKTESVKFENKIIDMYNNIITNKEDEDGEV